MERLMDLSEMSLVIKASVPDKYEGYHSRVCSYTMDDRAITTVVTKVHRWDKEDALIVDATVTNNSGAVLTLDRDKMSKPSESNNIQ
jgi:hypothetical protein